MPRVECPKCSAWVAVNQDAIGQLAECRVCNAVFPVIEISEDEADADPETGAIFAPRHDSETSNSKKLVIERARREVRVSGIGLMVTGLLGLAAAIVIGLYKIVGELQWPQPDYEHCILVAGIAIAVSVGSLLIAIGGWALLRHRYRALCYVSAVFSMSLGILGVWAIIPALAVVFGSMAFAALANNNVKQAMRWKAKERDESRQWEE